MLKHMNKVRRSLAASLASAALLCSCIHPSDRNVHIEISTATPIIRVEYPNPAGPVEVAAVPLDQLTQICVARAGVVEVRTTDDRIGYATATDLPAVSGLGVCDKDQS